MRPARLREAAFLLSVLATLAGASAAKAQRIFPSSASQILVFDDQLATWDMNEALFRFAATHYAGTQKVLRDDARHLRQYAPGFLVLHYRLGQALGHSTPQNCAPTTNYLEIIDTNQWIQEWPGDGNVQDEWFFHWQGSRVFSCSNGNYLMELDDAAWRQWWSNAVIAELQDNEDDGVFADSYSVPNYFGGCDWSPCLPDVDATFEAAWAAREHDFTDYMRGRFAGQWKWIPNVGAWITSRDPSDYSNVDGVMIEGFAEWGGGSYFDPSDWALQMNRILPLAGAGKILIGQSYPDASSVSERLFLLGTYLLVRGNRSYLNMEIGQDPEWFPEYDVALGPPSAPLPATIDQLFVPGDQIYEREFRNGLVLVNPSTSTHDVTLGASLFRVTPSGGGFVPASGVPAGTLAYSAVASVSLPAHTAAILVADPSWIFADGFESGATGVWSTTAL